MPTILGIDLGVSQCRTALAREGQAESFDNRFTGRRLPLLVRNAADPAQFVFRGIKQELGLDDPGMFPSGATPAKAAEEIFRGIREDARERAGEDVVHAVVSVPAFYSERRRAALRRAAENAGFERAHLLDESLAAILGAKPLAPAKRVLTFALGAGTCSASVVRILNGVPQALCNEGAGELGGDDFDAAIIQFILGRFGVTVAQFRDGADSLQKLRTIAEQVKIGLSKRLAEEFDVHTRELFSDAALEHIKNPDGAMSLTRIQFAEMIGESLTRALDVAQKAVEGAQLGTDRLDLTVLVGGSTRVPAVEQAVREKFGAETTRLPDDAVALGAARHGVQLGADAWQKREEMVHSGPPPEVPRRVAVLPKDVQPLAGFSGWAGMFAPGLQEAEAHWQAGNHADAIAALERIEKELPRFIANLHTQRGKLQVQANQFDEAIASLERALDLDPNDKDARGSLHVAYNRKAVVLVDAGRLEEARMILRKGVRLEPNCEACPQLLKQVETTLEHGGFRGGPPSGFRRRRRR